MTENEFKHFNPVNFGNKDLDYVLAQFDINKLRDERKYNKCVESSIDIIYMTERKTHKSLVCV